MARNERYDDERPAKKGNGLAIGLAIGGGVLALLLVGGCIVGVVFIRGAKKVVEQAESKEQAAGGAAKVEPKAGTPRKVISRKEFEAAVSGRTRDQITAVVGRPDDTKDNVPGQGGVGRVTFTYNWWYFWDRVANEATGKPYPIVAVRFNANGIADRIDYP